MLSTELSSCFFGEYRKKCSDVYENYQQVFHIYSPAFCIDGIRVFHREISLATPLKLVYI